MEPDLEQLLGGIDRLIGSDHHAAHLRELYGRGDWPALVRYFIGHQHKPALRLASLLLGSAGRRGGDGHVELIIVGMMFSTHLINSAQAALMPTQDLPPGQWTDEQRLTVELFKSYTEAGLCEIAHRMPLKKQVALFSAGLRAAERACQVAGQLGDRATLGLMRSMMGGTLTHLRQFDAARRCFDEAVSIRRELAARRPDLYGPDLALTLSHVGTLQFERGELAAAEANFKDSVQLYRQGIAFDPDLCRAGVARSLVNVANVQQRLGEFTAARRLLEEALPILRREKTALGRASPQGAQAEGGHEVADCLNNLGNVLAELGEIALARRHLEEAVTLVRPYAEAGSEFFQHRLATYTTNLAALSRREGSLDIHRFRQAADLYRELIQKQPLVYRPLLATTLGNLGAAHLSAGAWEEAGECLREAADLFSDEAAARPTAFLRERMLCWSHLADYHINPSTPGDSGEAGAAADLPAARDALRVARDCAELQRGGVTDPASREALQSEASQVYDRLFKINVAMSRGDGKAAAALREAFEVAEAARARTLGELLSDEQLAPTSAPPEEVDRFREVRGRLHTVRRQLHERRASRAARAAAPAGPADGRPDGGPNEAPGRGVTAERANADEQAAGESEFNRADREQVEATPVPEAELEAEADRIDREYRERLRHLRDAYDPDFNPDEPLTAIAFEDAVQLIPRDVPTAVVHYSIGPDFAEALIITLEGVESVSLPGVNSAKVGELLENWFRAYAKRPAAQIERFRPGGQPTNDPRRATRLRMLGNLKKLVESGVLDRVDRPAPSGGTGETPAHPADAPKPRMFDPQKAHDIEDPEQWYFEVMGQAIGHGELKGLLWLEWEKMLPQALQPVAELVVHPVAEALKGRGVRRLIISPSRGLQFFPLHACPLDKLPHFAGADPLAITMLGGLLSGGPVGRSADPPRCLADEYEILYAPSMSILYLCARRNRREKSRLLVVKNPTYDLPFSDVESAAIHSRYPDHQVLGGQAATKERFASECTKAHVLQFSGHARFDPTDPLASALVLGDRDDASRWLSLREIFSGLRMEENLLTILGGCESGMVVPDVVDGSVGLPAGFLYAGAACVISSLWEVYDLSTALLMDRFHAEWQSGCAVAEAMDKAQRWLRREIRSGPHLRDEILPAYAARLDSADLQRLCREAADHYAKLYPDSPPFASPAHWGAFVVTGWGMPALPELPRPRLRPLTFDATSRTGRPATATVPKVSRAATAAAVGVGVAGANDVQARLSPDPVPALGGESATTAADPADLLAGLGPEGGSDYAGAVLGRLKSREMQSRMKKVVWHLGGRSELSERLKAAKAAVTTAVGARRADGLLDAAITRLEGGETSSALASFAECVDACDEADPGTAPLASLAQLAIGKLHLVEDRHCDALRAFRRSLSHRPAGIGHMIATGLAEAIAGLGAECVERIHEAAHEPGTAADRWGVEELTRGLNEAAPLPYKKAREVFRDMLAAAKRRRCARSWLWVLVALHSSAVHAGDWRGATKALGRARRALHAVPVDEREAWTGMLESSEAGQELIQAGPGRWAWLHQRGGRKLKASRFDEALDAFQAALNGCRRDGDDQGAATNSVALARTLLETGWPVEAERYMADAEAWAEREKDAKMLEGVRRMAAEARRGVDNPSAQRLIAWGWHRLRCRRTALRRAGDAVELFRTAAVAARREGNDEHLATALLGHAHALMLSLRPLDALTIAGEAADVARCLKPGQVSDLLVRQLEVLKRTAEEHAARISALESKVSGDAGAVTNDGNDLALARRFLQEAVHSAAARDPVAARHLADRAADLSSSAVDPSITALSLTLKAEVACGCGMPWEAQGFASEALALAEREGWHDLTRRLREIIRRVDPATEVAVAAELDAPRSTSDPSAGTEADESLHRSR